MCACACACVCVCVCACAGVCVCAGPQPPHHLSQVEHRLLDVLPAIKRGKVRGKMEGLAVAGKEQQVCFKEDIRDVCEWVASCVASDPTH